MKFNKWTLGLAAVGVVSLASAARADESKMSQVQTALSNTTISGYVDVSAQFNPGGGGSAGDVAPTPNYSFGNKANQINLNVVDIALDKPLDESPWASGYHVELWLGPDGSALNTGNSSAAIRQAYVALRTPLGNGVDWKVGVFDSIIGYEGLSSGNNPNYSHSYGFNIEPTTMTGVLATYKVCEVVTVQGGIADTAFANTAYNAQINGLPSNGYTGGLSYPSLMGLVSLTAPESWGWAKGGVLSGGIVNTSGGATTGATSYYVGVTVPTPVANWKLGGAFDYLNVNTIGNTWSLAGYTTFAFNDKLSLNLRAEHLDGKSALNGGAYYNTTSSQSNAADEITATLQYNIWENVISRLELRWDHVEHGNGYASTSSNYGEGSNNGGTQSEAWLVGAQVIYKF